VREKATSFSTARRKTARAEEKGHWRDIRWIAHVVKELDE
jgi:hypothetical protein